MTHAELEEAKHDMVRPWLARARATIDSRLRDARAHGERGSIVEANARLATLAKELGGTIRQPEAGLVGEARGAFYRGSFALQRKRLDPAIHDLELAPQADDVLTAQRHPIGGSHFSVAIQDIIQDDAGRSLGLAAAVTQSAELSPQAKKAVWDNWERTSAEKTNRRVERELKTTSIALYEVVGRLMLRPEHR